MDLQSKKDDAAMQIRNKLRSDNIKLWLEPYYNNTTGPSDDDLKRLGENYCTSLKLPYEDSIEILKELQRISLENLKQSHRYKECGLATLKIKVLNAGETPRIISKELSLMSTVSDLKQLIASEIGVDFNRFKIIASGRLLNDTTNLIGQGIKNGQYILVAILANDQLQDNENDVKDVEAIKSDCRLLAADKDYMVLEDQFGNAMQIPKDEKKALIVAMALHEKGRTLIRRANYSRALIYLLEADDEFHQCNSKLLDTVDNYALLDLDIAWCYLMLQSISNLPEACERLHRCEQRFNKTYGTNLERLIALKGVTGNEAPLLLRLHLLQGIISYHLNRRQEAMQLFRKVQEELMVLKVDEDSILMLVELGYSSAEARLGLRVNHGDVNAAAEYIKENRDKRAQTRKQNLTDEILQKKRMKLGKCDDGKQYVDPNLVKTLVGFGYNKEAARIALAKTNNIISDSIQYIEDNPMPGPSGSKSTEMLSLVNDLASELEAAGFNLEMAKSALEKNMGDIIKAVDDLLMTNANPTTVSQTDVLKTELIKKMKKENEKQQAFLRLSNDLSMVDDDHLDISLDEEELFLKQYLSLLE